MLSFGSCWSPVKRRRVPINVFPNDTSKLASLFKSLFLQCRSSSRKAVNTSFNNITLTKVSQSTRPSEVHKQVAISCLHLLQFSDVNIVGYIIAVAESYGMYNYYLLQLQNSTTYVQMLQSKTQQNCIYQT